MKTRDQFQHESHYIIYLGGYGDALTDQMTYESAIRLRFEQEVADALERSKTPSDPFDRIDQNVRRIG